MNGYYIETTGMGSCYLWKRSGPTKLTLMAIKLAEDFEWVVPGSSLASAETGPRMIVGWRNIKKYAHKLELVSDAEAFLALL